MDRPTIKIIAPISKEEVEINEWITGAEAEYVDAPVEAAIAEAKLKIMLDKPVDMEKVGAIDTQRTIEKFVVSLNGSRDNIVERVKGLSEIDLKFIIGKINKLREDLKKKAVTSIE